MCEFEFCEREVGDPISGDGTEGLPLCGMHRLSIQFALKSEPYRWKVDRHSIDDRERIYLAERPDWILHRS